MYLVDVICPDCGNGLRIDLDKLPGHCHYCGRLIRVNRETLEVYPGKGEEQDIIETQYEFLRKHQMMGDKSRKKGRAVNGIRRTPDRKKKNTDE